MVFWAGCLFTVFYIVNVIQIFKKELSSILLRRILFFFVPFNFFCLIYQWKLKELDRNWVVYSHCSILKIVFSFFLPLLLFFSIQVFWYTSVQCLVVYLSNLEVNHPSWHPKWALTYLNEGKIGKFILCVLLLVHELVLSVVGFVVLAVLNVLCII